jgi:hypothetical protein
MKRNEIIGEHKKGFKAKKYAQKPKTYIEPTKPQKPQAPVSEEAKITKSDASGVEITAADGVKTTLPPEKAAALTPDPSNPNEYDLNPAATSPTGDTPAGPKVGANVEIKTAEATGDTGLGTIPTTEFVKGIYSLAAEYGPEAPNPDAVKKMMVLAPNGEVDLEQTFNKVIAAFQAQLPQLEKMLNELEALVQGAEATPMETSGDMQSKTKAASISQAPDGTYTVTYNRAPLSTSGTDLDGQIPPPQTGIKDLASAQRILASIDKEESTMASIPSSIQEASQRRAADNELLEKMRMIAGLR